MGEGPTMVKLHIWIFSVFWAFVYFDTVCGNCSGGVTSQTVNYGDSGSSVLILPSVIKYATCTWEVKSTTNGLRLDLEDFIIPRSDLCEQGYLQITVGEYGKFDAVSLDKWCGEFYPRSLYLSGHVTIKLHLEHTRLRVGIKLKYTSVLPSEFCQPPPRNLTGSGYIFSPGYGGHWTVAPSLSCDWQIQADPGHVVQVEILHVDFSGWACSRQQAKLIAYDGSDRLDEITTWCTSDVLNVVKSTRSGLHLGYINRVPHRGSGFYLKYYQVPDYHSDCAYFVRDVIARRTPSFINIFQAPNPRVNCRWNITTERENETVVMETEYYDLGVMGCSHAEMNYYDGPGESAEGLQERVCRGIQLSSHNVIQSSGRHAYLDMKYNPTSADTTRALIRVYSVPKTPCWKDHRIYTADWSLSRLWLPVDGSSQRSCEIRIQSSVANTCIKVEISSKTGYQLSIYDYFSIYDGSDTSSTQYGSRCSPNGKSYTHSTGHTLLLVRRLSPLGSHVTLPNIDGFWLDYSTDGYCDKGDYIEINTGAEHFQSLMLPERYSNDTTTPSQVCHYIVTTNSTTSLLQIHLSDDNPINSSDSNCNQNAAIISDGIDGGNEIGRWCTGRSQYYTSTTNRVYITYMQGHSSHQYPTVFYRSWPKDQCAHSLLAPEGSPLTFSSPYYPRNYPNLASCSWRITASRSNHRVELHLKEMSIDAGSGANCSQDYLVVYDGPTNSNPEIKRTCGQEVENRPVRSSGQVMDVKFHSDYQMTAKGFLATYKSVKLFKCNETLQAPDQDGPQQFLSSPFFPNHYHDNMVCYWLLETSQDHVIQTEMAMSEFTGSHSTCSGDSLIFYNGKDETAPRIGHVCGIELPKYRSSGRYMYIIFQSDNNGVTARGFQLQYYNVFLYSSCQGTAIGKLYGNTSKAGLLSSPFYPMGFPSGLMCRWRVSVSPGYQVKITVDQSDVTSNCNTFQVKFYDGPQSTGKDLGTWCGEKDRYFTSTEDRLYMSFQSHRQTRTGFRLAYQATGSGTSWSQTALIVGIIVGSIFLLVIIFTIGICCCCCCGENKKKSPPSEDDSEESTGGKKKASEPLLKEGRKYAKESALPVVSLVPTAPPMEDGGIDNFGFEPRSDQANVCNNDVKHHSIYPAFPTAHDIQKSEAVIDGIMIREGLIGDKWHNVTGPEGSGYVKQTLNQQPGVSTKHPFRQIHREVAMRMTDVPVNHQQHLGNSCSHKNMIQRHENIHPTDVDPKIHDSSRNRYEQNTKKTDKRNHNHQTHGKHDEHTKREVTLGVQTNREVELERKQTKSSSEHDPMRFIEIIEYGKENEGRKGKKDTKKKNKKKKKKEAEEKDAEPMKQTLKKRSSIECNELDESGGVCQSPVAEALQSRHQIQEEDPNFIQTNDTLTNVPFVLSPNAYMESMYQEPSPLVLTDYRYPDQFYQQPPWLAYPEQYQGHSMGPEVPRGNGNHQVIHADVHFATPNITDQYPGPDPNQSAFGYPGAQDTIYRYGMANEHIMNPTPAGEMYPISHVSSLSNPGMIWSTDQSMMPHYMMVPHDDDEGTWYDQSSWSKPPVNLNIKPVPMLIPIPEVSFTIENEISGRRLEVEDGNQPVDTTNHETCPPISTQDVSTVDDDVATGCLSQDQRPSPPDPAKLNTMLPPQHWIRSEKYTEFAAELQTIADFPAYSDKNCTTDIACQTTVLPKNVNAHGGFEDCIESDILSKANNDQISTGDPAEHIEEEINTSTVSTKNSTTEIACQTEAPEVNDNLPMEDKTESDIVSVDGNDHHAMEIPIQSTAHISTVSSMNSKEEIARQTDVPAESSPADDTLIKEDGTEFDIVSRAYTDKLSSEEPVEPTIEDIHTDGCDNSYIKGTLQDVVAEPIASNLTSHDEAPTVTRSEEEVKINRNDKQIYDALELEDRCPTTEDPTSSSQLEGSLDPRESDLEDLDLHSENEDEAKVGHQRKLEILLQRGFTDNDVEDMNETAV